MNHFCVFNKKGREIEKETWRARDRERERETVVSCFLFIGRGSASNQNGERPELNPIPVPPLSMDDQLIRSLFRFCLLYYLSRRIDFLACILSDDMNLHPTPEEVDGESDQSNNNSGSKRGRRRKRNDADVSDADDADDVSDDDPDERDLKKAHIFQPFASDASAMHPLIARIHSTPGGTPNAAFPYAATLANANVTLDALQNTKMAIAQFAANAMANKVSHVIHSTPSRTCSDSHSFSVSFHFIRWA